jgi:hypothetical protein
MKAARIMQKLVLTTTPRASVRDITTTEGKRLETLTTQDIMSPNPIMGP